MKKQNVCELYLNNTIIKNVVQLKLTEYYVKYILKKKKAETIAKSEDLGLTLHRLQYQGSLSL